MIRQVSVEELKTLMDSGADIVLVDCREPDEHAYCKIPGAVNIPSSQFAGRAAKELDPKSDILIHCHHGGRSQKACEFLAEKGYARVANVAGGIDAWSLRVDPKVPRY